MKRGKSIRTAHAVLTQGGINLNTKDLTTTQGKDQFYPTPPSVAEKMLAGLDMAYIGTVLEPSAGKGDLVRAIAEKNRIHYRHRDLDVDCCEIDPYLRQILQYNFSAEKKQEIIDKNGYGNREYDLIDNTKLHVVHDDFLTYSSMKHYDLILMNPPFADGARHLLKALHMQKDGGLVICLLNAETLRNPYTDSDRIQQDRVSDAQWSYMEQATELGARCFVICGFRSGNVYKVPWAAWRTMKETFGHKHMTEKEIACYKVAESWNDLLLVLD